MARQIAGGYREAEAKLHLLLKELLNAVKGGGNVWLSTLFESPPDAICWIMDREVPRVDMSCQSCGCITHLTGQESANISVKNKTAQ